MENVITVLVVGLVVGFLLGICMGMYLEDTFDIVKFRDKRRKNEDS